MSTPSFLFGWIQAPYLLPPNNASLPPQKSIDTREAAGFPTGPPELVRAALTKHFLFASRAQTASVADGGATEPSEVDAALAVMVPRKLNAGEALFPAAAAESASAEGGNGGGDDDDDAAADGEPEAHLQICFVLASGSLESPAGQAPSAEAVAATTGPVTPSGKFLNPVALVDPSWPQASPAAARVASLVAGAGGAQVWGLAAADFRAAMAESALSKVALW